MKKASEYRQHAAECRKLAETMPTGDQREQLLAMAETWDKLAREREALNRVQAMPDLARKKIEGSNEP
ncbi:hypothetical protein [Microvirga rosea]|uniref:hypothetical protein n=1 Tax=Microvirga rosea TaxID=2715425 RepID=UPI001D09BAD6|nr:hypothetical protein [Microvirga rosea]MCB8820221.1 hypothetical protein [Microvirga rosea]